MISTLLLDLGLVLWFNNVHYSSVQLSRPLGHFEIHLTCWNQNELITLFNYTVRHVDLIKKKGRKDRWVVMLDMGAKDDISSWHGVGSCALGPASGPQLPLRPPTENGLRLMYAELPTLLKWSVCSVVLEMVQGFEGYDQMPAELLVHFVYNSHQVND